MSRLSAFMSEPEDLAVCPVQSWKTHVRYARKGKLNQGQVLIFTCQSSVHEHSFSSGCASDLWCFWVRCWIPLAIHSRDLGLFRLAGSAAAAFCAGLKTFTSLPSRSGKAQEKVTCHCSVGDSELDSGIHCCNHVPMKWCIHSIQMLLRLLRPQVGVFLWAAWWMRMYLPNSFWVLLVRLFFICSKVAWALSDFCSRLRFLTCGGYTVNWSIVSSGRNSYYLPGLINTLYAVSGSGPFPNAIVPELHVTLQLSVAFGHI